MSDFYMGISLLRGDISTGLVDNFEHAMWVLGDLVERMDPVELAEFVETMDADVNEVATFLRKLADEISITDIQERMDGRHQNEEGGQE